MHATIGAMAGIRERVRAEVTAEIIRLARVQVAAEGAPSLSLRAIARDLGMASSAIYRYFPSRDELLTALIVESYASLGEAVEAAETQAAGAPFRERWRVICREARRWALANPSDYGLIFGTPVPGYQAPPDTIGPATRYTSVLVRLLADIAAAGHGPVGELVVSKALHREYDLLRTRMGVDADDRLLAAGLAGWSTLFGAISFEVFGHLRNVIDDRDSHFDAVVELLGDMIVGSTTEAVPTRRKR
jgi:AcrR family transcriptional regulator